MTRPRVAVAGCRDLGEYDADWPLLRESLETVGIYACYAPWDDDHIDWGSFDLVVIRSTWDYVPRAAEFLAWAERIAGATALLNPLEVIRWNLNKTYLADLDAEGVVVIPTDWVTPADIWSAPTGEFVVKPSISAGAVETARYRPEDRAEAAAHVGRLQAQGHTVMVQPYMQAVDAEGEIALVMIAGILSHAARKGAMLRVGEGVVPSPMDRLTVTPTTPRPAEVSRADHVAASLRRRFGEDPLYCRVDLVNGPSGEPLVLEVELIEPALFLPTAPGSADRLAAAIGASFSGRR